MDAEGETAAAKAGVAVVLLTKALMTYDSNLREERDTYSYWYAYLVPFRKSRVEMHGALCQISEIESEGNF